MCLCAHSMRQRRNLLQLVALKFMQTQLQISVFQPSQNQLQLLLKYNVSLCKWLLLYGNHIKYLSWTNNLLIGTVAVFYTHGERGVLGISSDWEGRMGAKIKTKKILCKSPSLSFQKGLNDIRWKVQNEIIHGQGTWAPPPEHYHKSSDCFEYPQKSLLKSSQIKTYLPKNPWIIPITWNPETPWDYTGRQMTSKICFLRF